MNKFVRDVILLMVLTVSFLVVFFLIQLFFFEKDSYNTVIEENYIDKTKEEIDLNSLSEAEKMRSNELLAQEIKKEALRKQKIEQFFQSQKSTKEVAVLEQKKYSFQFIPEDIRGPVGEKTDSIRFFLETDFTSALLRSLTVNYIAKVQEVRGKMKNASVLLFGVERLSKEEILSVFIHEFGHYIDIYFFEGDFVNSDKSTEFYHISWDSTKVLLAGQGQKDFVSGYAMTNKYEDFAESFVYYVLHNGDFKEKAAKSSVLKRKYEFIQENLFSGAQFAGTDFSKGNKVLDYYRDITKIDFDITNFLQYLEKYI